MKVYTHPPREDWICDRLVSEWRMSNSDIDVNSPTQADIVWLLAGWCWRHIDHRILANKKVICTIHHIVPDKFYNSNKHIEFSIRDQLVDAYHVPNDTTGNMIRQLTTKPIHVIPYWCNDKLWFPQNKEKARKELRLGLTDFIIGSFQRDTEGGTLHPKLEKGPDIFCDYITRVSKIRDVHVLLGGWRRGYVIERLKEQKIRYTLLEKSSENMLRAMYNSCDLYVVSSRFEGGPQAVIECAAMNIPIISNNVGIASKVLHEDCIVDISKTQKIDISSGAIDYNLRKVKELFIDVHKLRYRKMIEEVNEQ